MSLCELSRDSFSGLIGEGHFDLSDRDISGILFFTIELCVCVCVCVRARTHTQVCTQQIFFGLFLVRVSQFVW